MQTKDVQTKPEWCGWWSDAEWSRFVRLLRVLDRDQLVSGDDALRQVAEQARDAPSGTWSSAIKSYLAAAVLAPAPTAVPAAAPATPEAPQQAPSVAPLTPTADLVSPGQSVPISPVGGAGSATPAELAALGDLRAQLRVQVARERDAVTESADGGRLVPMMRPLGSGLVELIQLDEGHGQLATPDRGIVENWRVRPELLFELGRENVRVQPVERVYDQERRVYTLSHPSSDLVGARLTMLGQEPQVGPYGCLVGLPHRNGLLYHPVKGDAEQLAGALAALYSGVAAEYQRPDARPVSDRIYWWRDGELTEVQIRGDASNPEITLPWPLLELLGGLGDAPGAGDDTSEHVTVPQTFEQARAQLRVRLVPSAQVSGADFPGDPVTRPYGAGLVEVLSLTVGGQAEVPDQELVRRWGAAPDELFRIGRRNVAADPVTRDFDAEAGIYQLSHEESPFVASRLLTLAEHTSVGTYGFLATMPMPQNLFYHPAWEGQAFLKALHALIGYVEHLRTVLEPQLAAVGATDMLNTQAYWWFGGELYELPYRFNDGRMRLDLPEALEPVFQELTQS